ncbi:MAG: DUF5312 family protein [Alkalispirochaeta sp.]
MRRTSRYTVRFPDPIYPPAETYRRRFMEFPFWYRWYLRLRGLLGARSIEEATRAHHLQELRRRLDRTARSTVDCGVPALLPAFHQRVRSLKTQLQRIRPALDETTGLARGAFLRTVLEQSAPDVAERLHQAATFAPDALADPELSLPQAQARVRSAVGEALEREVADIERRLAPIWTALRTLNLLQRVDLDVLLPVQGARREQTPLRVVQSTMLHLHQTLELCHRHLNPEATGHAWTFAHQRIRSQPGPPRAIWSEIEEFRSAVPFVDLVRYAAGEPFLEIPELSIKSDWWNPLREDWTHRSVERVGGILLEARQEAVAQTLSQTYFIDRAPSSWIPTALHPQTTGYLLLLAASDFFHDTRRAVSQLVIDAEFYHLDTRNTLHQSALQLDQALERLRALLGDERGPGTLREEIQRLQQRSTTSSVVRRQLTGLYERYRPRVRASIDETIDALERIGSLISRTEDGTERAYRVRELHSQSFSGDYSPHELLDIVATRWHSLGRSLRALYRLENDLTNRSRPQDPEIPDVGE